MMQEFHIQNKKYLFFTNYTICVTTTVTVAHPQHPPSQARIITSHAKICLYLYPFFSFSSTTRGRANKNVCRLSPSFGIRILRSGPILSISACGVTRWRKKTLVIAAGDNPNFVTSFRDALTVTRRHYGTPRLTGARHPP